MDSENRPSADSSSRGFARASAVHALNGHAVDGMLDRDLSRAHEEIRPRRAELHRDLHYADDDALPQNEFLHQLKREKRRSERSKASLSIVVYRVDELEALTPRQTRRALEAICSVKRETDILGHVGDDRIAVLCPDTDEQGIQGFVRKMASKVGDLPLEALVATYPDVLFEQLSDPTTRRPVLDPLLMRDAPANGRGHYPLKRCLDVVGALAAICLFGPLMLGIALVVAATSPGPVIFRQTRIGKGGVPFKFYKFRSMVTDVDDKIHREFVAGLINGGQARVDAKRPDQYKLQGDPRITRIGKFMRKTSIDELPQLFNVLIGDMSLVGPRPPIPYETAHYQSWHLRRVLAARPGMTGLWQVQGRSRVNFNEMVRMDLRYIEDCSVWLDLKILTKTIVVVVFCVGAS